ncbi:MAG: aminotransferase class I/II-fold pyridoxal phosphate-dependent enzyme [Actinomycetota bacterium]|nr:aminotransferase class I/II-fold pyridoxal phosphate-dependent enzyme [Actinomycetota bacterium]
MGDGLIRAIAHARGLAEDSVLLGAGSSALIYLALGTWLTRQSTVLLLDPTYGEYAHVLEQVLGARVDRLGLELDGDYDLDLDQLRRRVEHGNYDLVVVVNPNSPPALTATAPAGEVHA